MVREILHWCDNKMDESLQKDDDKIYYAKAFMTGALEGFIDGIVVTAAIGIATNGISAIVKAIKK